MPTSSQLPAHNRHTNTPRNPLLKSALRTFQPAGTVLACPLMNSLQTETRSTGLFGSGVERLVP